MIEELVVATSNAGKLRELREMLAGFPVRVRGLEEFETIPPVEETGKTFAENARLKARYYSEALGRVVLADDSGLEVAALGGAPGVHSARFAGVTGPERDRANNAKLLRLLGERPLEERQGRFRCALCLWGEEGMLLEVEGELEGLIATEPRGENGFGYDPLFYVPELGKTVAELPAEEKNVLSHRGRALRKLLERLRPLLESA